MTLSPRLRAIFSIRRDIIGQPRSKSKLVSDEIEWTALHFGKDTADIFAEYTQR